jgi:hypothetical protein
VSVLPARDAPVVSLSDVRAGSALPVNLTSNAAEISFATPSGTPSVILNSDLSAPSGAQSYSTGPFSSSTLRFCPAYLGDCFSGMLTDVAAHSALTACANGDPSWTLASTVTARVTEPNVATTLYVVGGAKPLASDHLSVVGRAPTIVIANDMTDGPLP